MIRLILIFVMATQLVGCSIVQTAVGTFVGTLSADAVKDEIEEDDDSKKR